MSQIHEGIYVREEKKVVVEFQVAMEYGLVEPHTWVQPILHPGIPRQRQSLTVAGGQKQRERSVC